MTLRARLHRQLHIGSWPDGKLTGLNVFVVWTILAALLVGIVATEPQIRIPYQHEILVAEFVFGTIFLLEYLGRIFALMLGWLCLPDCLALILANGRLAPGRLVRVVSY